MVNAALSGVIQSLQQQQQQPKEECSRPEKREKEEEVPFMARYHSKWGLARRRPAEGEEVLGDMKSSVCVGPSESSADSRNVRINVFYLFMKRFVSIRYVISEIGLESCPPPPHFGLSFNEQPFDDLLWSVTVEVSLGDVCVCAFNLIRD